MMRVPRTLLAGSTALALVAALGSGAVAAPSDDIAGGSRTWSAPDAQPDDAAPSDAAGAPVELQAALSGPAALTLTKLNQVRAAHSAPPVSDDAALDVVAQAWAEQSANDGTIGSNPGIPGALPDGWITGGELWASGPVSAGADALIGTALGDSNLSVTPFMTHVGIGYATTTAGEAYLYVVIMEYPARDVAPSDTFALDIWRMYDAGVTTGYPDGTYRPLGSVSREAMAAFLYRAQFGQTLPTCDPAKPRLFSDVSAGHPFCGAIEWLATNGISTGWPDHTYRPAEPVTREAMAAFLYRYAHVLDGVPQEPLTCDPTTVRQFRDVATGHPFCGAIEWISRNAIATGWPDGTYRPSAPIERQAMAAFLHRFGFMR